MVRPTIALCCILKNEFNNLPRLFDSITNCFDELHFTDTGSTDGSVEWLHMMANVHPQVHIHHFDWVNDFAAARNYSFSHATTDYVMWLDLDDTLSDAEAFINWRDKVMHLADYWIATYHYAQNDRGEPVCSFARERVVKNRRGFKWNYFVHEGIQASADTGPAVTNYATTWNVRHHRTPEDLAKDKGRNLKIFEQQKQPLDARMTYYYGKELFENEKPLEAYSKLMDAAVRPELEQHDRLLALQYAAHTAMLLNQPEQAIGIAYQGLRLDPMRAEYFTIIADSYIKQNKLVEAAPYYAAAMHCPVPDSSRLHHGAIFQQRDVYTHWPRLQLARIYSNLGQLNRAFECVEQAEKFGPNPEVVAVKTEIERLLKVTTIPKRENAKKVDEIAITCLPCSPYEWDERIEAERGIGGSETAVVYMARELAKKTGLKVRVFNNVTARREFGPVEYENCARANEYFNEKVPKLHIAWRHTERVTDAPTYIWCHDLFAAGIEHSDRYDKVLALSKFHADFLENLFRVPRGTIQITRNGIDPERLNAAGRTTDKTKPNVVFSSSPDRGLERAMRVMDKVVQKIPEARLSIFYGFDNMLKMGRKDEVEKLRKMVEERPYTEMVGNIQQAVLYDYLARSSVWLYPTNFLETFCITALEAQAMRVWPVVRQWGALPETVEQGTILGSDCETEKETLYYADHVIEALEKQKWRELDFSLEKHSWASVAEDWLKFLPL